MPQSALGTWNFYFQLLRKYLSGLIILIMTALVLLHMYRFVCEPAAICSPGVVFLCCPHTMVFIRNPNGGESVDLNSYSLKEQR